MTMPYGLLDQSAIQRLLAMKQHAADVPQAPNTGGLLAPNLPPPVPFNPNAPPPDLSAHTEQGGVRGNLMHLIGADKIAPELGALLTPEQRERVKPGLLATAGNFLLRGRTPAQAQMERAAMLTGLQDQKKARDKQARDERILANLQSVAATMPEQQGLEFLARMSNIYGLPQGEQAAVAAERLRPRQIQPRANAKLTILGTDGNYYAIQQDAMGAEVPGSRVRVPKPTAGITYKEGVAPDGTPTYYAMPSEESGDARAPIAPRETGVEAPPPAGEGGGGSRERTQIAVAANQAVKAHQDMMAYEEDLKRPEGDPRRATINVVQATLARRAFGQGVDSEVAMGILNSQNPRLANYIRGAKAIGVAERLITPRGGSNYLTQTESALSGVGANAPVSAVEQAAAYRQALVDGLLTHVPKETKGSSDKTITRAEFNQLSPAAQKAARDSGYTILP